MKNTKSRSLLSKIKKMAGQINDVELERYNVREWAKPCINQYRTNLSSQQTHTTCIGKTSIQDNTITFTIVSGQNKPYDLVLSVYQEQRIRLFIKNIHQLDPIFDLDDLLGSINLPHLLINIENQKLNKFSVVQYFQVNKGSLQIDVIMEPQLEIQFRNNDVLIISILPYFIQNYPAVIVRYHASPLLSGIPSHSDSLLLRDTVNDRPYQLYNCDRYLWSVNSRASMYGSNPQLFNFGQFGQNVLFWRNVSETYIDIHTTSEYREVFIVSEVNDFDIYLTFNFENEVQKLYLKLQPIIGKAFLPTLWSLAHQHSRYSFMTREDVLAVDAGYDAHKIPIDAFYLDLHHTGEGMKYFTWNDEAYPDPQSLLKHFEMIGRKIVTIQDPHLRQEDGYHVYDQFQQRDLLVKKDGTQFIGQAWPGNSVYVDFIDKDAQDLWSSQYDYAQYKDSHKISVWNDLNEPTVQDYESDIFCMPKDCTHRLKLTTGEKLTLYHKQVRLCYGMLQMKATQEGLLQRDGGTLRNIAFTRSFFTGVQQYAIVWTADAESTFKYLCATTPLLLSYSLVGMSFNGGDVPGFQYEPAEDLCQRWYQLGAFQPFFRSHSNFGTPRREPWLFSNVTLENIRQNVQYRYQLLPFWYTQFYDNHKTAMPVLRPLWLNFPKQEQLYVEQQIYMIGDGVIVVPVVSRNQKWFSLELLAFLQEPIYNYWCNKTIQKLRLVGVYSFYHQRFFQIESVYSLLVGLFYLVSLRIMLSIVIRMIYNIYVSKAGKASGQLFIDDGITYLYEKGFYILLQIQYDNGYLQLTRIEGNVSQYMIQSPIYNKIIQQITLCYPDKDCQIFNSLTISTLQDDQIIKLL